MKKIRILLLTIIISVTAGGFSNGQWIKTSMPDKQVKCMLAKDGYLFAGTWGEGIYRSTDNGVSWNVANNGLPDFYARWVYALIVAKSSSGPGTFLYAGMEYGGVYRSTDNGSNWTYVSAGIKAISIIALGSSGSTILAGTASQPGSNGVYRSVDDGGSWTMCNGGFSTDADSNVLSFTSVNTGVSTYFFAGTVGGVFISNSDGTSWTRATSGLGSAGYFYAMGARPSGGITGNNIFAGSYGGGIFRSTDLGSTWSIENNGLPVNYPPYISNFVVSPSLGGKGGNIFALADIVYVSTDNGGKWWDAGWPYSTAGPAYCAAINGDYIFCGEYGSLGGIWKYSLAVDTGWVVQQSGKTDTLYSVKAVDNNVVWAAGTNGGVFRTTNGGTNWIAVGGGTIGTDAAYGIEPLDANTAFVGAYSASSARILKTTNGGTSWTNVFTQPGGFIDGIQMKTSLEGYALGSPVGSGKWSVLKTTDGGNSWNHLTTEPVPTGTAEHGILTFQLLGNTLWFGNESGKIYRSTDLGATWETASTSGAFVFGLHFNSPTLGLAGFNNGIANRSMNGGGSWDSVSAVGSKQITCISGLGGEFWATTGAEIAFTNTNGDTWIGSSPGFTGIVPLNAVSISPVSSNVNGWAVGEDGIILHYSRNGTGVSPGINTLPTSYVLEQNFPNPFNPSTIIKYSVPKEGHVSLTVYDITGKEITKLVDGERQAGNYEVIWSAEKMSSGIYFYRIQSGGFVQTNKMILLK